MYRFILSVYTEDYWNIQEIPPEAGIEPGSPR